MKLKNKRGNILTENVIFIILNLFFLTILILFLFSKMSSVAVLEEKYAKQIALIIDSAKPFTEISLNMEDAIEKAKDEWGENKISSVISKHGQLVMITENIVTVKLSEKSGYSYSFFNDVDATTYLKNDKEYLIIINEKTKDE